MKLSAIFLAAAAALSPAMADGVSGAWQGELNGQKVEIDLREAAGAITGRFRALNSGIDVPLSGTIAGANVTFGAAAVSLQFTGTLDGSELEGTATRWSKASEASFERSEPVAPETRPQDPQGPLPYASEEVTFDVLAGTLTVPSGQGPFPAVVLVTPEGPQDRNAQGFGHRPNLVLADALTRAGFVVLRYDDRGVGASGGDYYTATTVRFAADAARALAFLKARPEVDPQRTAIVGRGNGASLAAIAGAGATKALVLISPSGLVGAEAANANTAREMRAKGEDEDDIAERITLQKRAFAVAADPTKTDADIRATVEALINEAAGMMSMMVSDDMIDAMARQLSAPWFRHYLSYDPKPDYAKLAEPVLVLYGGDDRSNPPGDNAEQVSAAIASGGGRAQVTVLPGLNAALATPPPEKASNFQRTETLNQAAIEAIARFLATTLAAS